jgi:hypothetical protein
VRLGRAADHEREGERVHRAVAEPDEDEQRREPAPARHESGHREPDPHGDEPEGSDVDPATLVLDAPDDEG